MIKNLNQKKILRMIAVILVLLAAMFLFVTAGDNAVHSVWVEGEDAAEKSVTAHPWWYEQVKTGEFSGGAFLAHYDQSGKTGTALYRFEIPANGEYTFWMRVNTVAGPTLEFQFDNDGRWTALNLNDARDQINVAADDAPDMRFLAWVRAGTFKLNRGQRALRVRLGGSPIQHGFIDCFLLTTGSFTPSGARKPASLTDNASQPANPGCWAFNPPEDTYSPNALFNLRVLLDDTAGSKGWIKFDKDGNFTRGDGSPVRFWSVNTNIQTKSLEEIEEQARFLSKRGVNMVRHHGALNPPPGQPLRSVNEAEIDRIHKLVAVMKKEGIYTTISPFWASAVPVQRQYNLYRRSDRNFEGLLFWDKTVQEAYKGWIRELFTRPNPYDPKKRPLRDDPAFAIFQIQNEDSMLFWTMQEVQTEPSRRDEWNALQEIFKTWLRDNRLPANTQLDFQFWNIDSGGAPGTGNPSQNLRLSMRFAAETMRKFNEDIEKFIREELRCPVLINAGNWTVANTARLLDHERWSYDANQVIGLNRYVDAGHWGDRVGYLVAKDQIFNNTSCLRDNWRAIPSAVKQVRGKPVIISESTWVSPNIYQSEGPFLVASYSLLTGVDSYYWFSLENTGFDPSITKWQAANPAIMGGFPAAAWMFHKGYVKHGETVVSEKRSLADMWELRTPVITEDSTYDPNRPGTQAARVNITGGVPYGAFFMGPVYVDYDADPSGTTVNLFGQNPETINRGIVRSNTGELQLDAVKGICILDAPKAQGVTGFLKEAGVIKTANLEIVSANDYASVLTVSLDDLPLSESGKILLQITTLCRPYGWKEEPVQREGRPALKITDTGSSPWSVVNTDMTVTIANRRIRTAALVDANFYQIATIPAERINNGLRIKLPANAMYVILM